jgi:antirestriction protein ArdC
MQEDIDNTTKDDTAPCSTRRSAAHNHREKLFQTVAHAAVGQSPSCELATGPVHPKVPSKKERMTMAKEDLYQKVTDTIVAELERGVAPWVQPWRTLDARFGGGPFNGYTARGYRGVNVLLLLVAAAQKGYQDSRWFTYRQAQTLGAQVRRGEKSTLVIFWKQLTFQKKDEESGDEARKRVPLLRSYAVFNAEQCEGLPALPTAEERAPELRYAVAQTLFTRHGVDVRYGGDKAFFTPTLDFIQMPRLEAFESEEHYWGTKLHELTHWTGHKSRLDRDLAHRFGSQAYAAEELVAEMGSAFLCAHLAVEGRLRHPEYIGHWLKVLRDDKRAVFKASSLAQAAADFVLDRKEEAPEPSDANPSAEVLP